MGSIQLTRYTAGAGALAAVAVLGACPAAHSEQRAEVAGSAFGLAATGPVQIAPLPEAISTNDQTARRSLVRPPANPLLDADVLQAVAGPGKARSSVADVRVVKTALKAAAITATCTNGKGSASLADAVLAGRKLASAPPANTTVPVSVDGLGTVSATLNRQVRRPDGRLAVTALVVRLPVGGQSIEVANATCGKVAANSGDVAEAPAPKPVRNDLPVTG